MRELKLIAALSMVLTGALASSDALAHPGAKLLTTGDKSGPAAMSAGVSFEDINGVHVFRGRTLEADTLLGGEPAADRAIAEREIEIIIHERRWRSFRRLRTQGFYSGNSYPSRQYTQGFYNGQR